jgi:hypothetical protein
MTLVIAEGHHVITSCQQHGSIGMVGADIHTAEVLIAAAWGWLAGNGYKSWQVMQQGFRATCTCNHACHHVSST